RAEFLLRSNSSVVMDGLQQEGNTHSALPKERFGTIGGAWASKRIKESIRFICACKNPVLARAQTAAPSAQRAISLSLLDTESTFLHCDTSLSICSKAL